MYLLKTKNNNCSSTKDKRNLVIDYSAQQLSN